MKKTKLKDIIRESSLERKRVLAEKSRTLLAKIKQSFKQEFGI